MNWEAISAIGQIVGALAAVISLINLARELRSNARNRKEHVFQSRKDVHNIIAIAFCKGDYRNQTTSNPRKAWHLSVSPYYIW
jgi:hypothetical protein